MKTLLTQFISAAVISAAFSFLASCTESPSEPVDATPKPGSTYTFSVYETDLDGNIDPDSRITITDSLITTSLSFFGSEDVHQIRTKGEYGYFKAFGNSSFEMYQDSIVIMDGLVVPQMWMHYNGTSMLDTIHVDSVRSVFNGYPGTMTVTVSTAGKGNSTYTPTGGKALSTVEVEDNFIVVVRIDGVGEVSTTTITTKLSYSPELEYIAREEVISNSDSPFSPIPNGKSVRELLSYSLK
ncbi:MAG TPA: hypothetical protein VIX80_10300 [Candidatus Kapabacteria bacterium]